MANKSEPEWFCIQFHFSSPSVAVLESDSEMDVGQSKDTTLKTDTSDLMKEESKTLGEPPDNLDNDNVILDKANDKETLEVQSPAQLPLTLKQKQCPEIGEIYAYIESKKVPDNPDRAKAIVYEAVMFDIVDGSCIIFKGQVQNDNH